jgi:hypothetical protein
MFILSDKKVSTALSCEEWARKADDNSSIGLA